MTASGARDGAPPQDAGPPDALVAPGAQAVDGVRREVEVSRAFASVLVFGTSGAVLVLEILAGRLLAPHVGVSLETYTGIIGVVLAGIAVGTWSGGRLADAHDPRRLLGPLVVVGGALALLVVPLVSLVAALRPGRGPEAIVLYAAVAFFAPAAVLSAVNPAVAKLVLRDLRETGSVVGWLSAAATAGALVGTFTTGFVLIAALPSRPIVLAVGSALICVGLLLWVRLSRGHGTGASVIAIAVLAAGVSPAVSAPDPCDRESAYFCIRVEPDTSRSTGRTLYLDGLRHSYVDLRDPRHLEFTYAQLVADAMTVVAPPASPVRALFIGGGGFTLPRYLASTRPGSKSLVVELDPLVVATAREELGLVTSPDLDVRIGDARLHLRDEPSAGYDLVVGDAFGGLAVPWHLTTAEFVSEVRRVVRPGGLYVINVIDYPPLGFARAELATLRSIFPHTAILATRGRISGREGGNFVFVASDAAIPAGAIRSANRARGDMDDVVADRAALDAFTTGAPILTDDYGPVDQLLTPTR